MSVVARCATCRYWHRQDGDLGTCHHCAPTVLWYSVLQDIVTRWPTCLSREWCGEYEPREAQTPHNVLAVFFPPEVDE